MTRSNGQGALPLLAAVTKQQQVANRKYHGDAGELGLGQSIAPGHQPTQTHSRSKKKKSKAKKAECSLQWQRPWLKYFLTPAELLAFFNLLFKTLKEWYLRKEGPRAAARRQGPTSWPTHTQPAWQPIANKY